MEESEIQRVILKIMVKFFEDLSPGLYVIAFAEFNRMQFQK